MSLTDGGVHEVRRTCCEDTAAERRNESQSFYSTRSLCVRELPGTECIHRGVVLFGDLSFPQSLEFAPHELVVLPTDALGRFIVQR